MQSPHGVYIPKIYTHEVTIMTDSDQRLARIEGKIDTLVEHSTVTRATQAAHNERIKMLETAARWVAGILASMLAGLGLHFTIGKS